MSILWMAFFAEAEGEVMDISARNPAPSCQTPSSIISLPLYPFILLSSFPLILVSSVSESCCVSAAVWSLLQGFLAYRGGHQEKSERATSKEPTAAIDWLSSSSSSSFSISLLSAVCRLLSAVWWSLAVLATEEKEEEKTSKSPATNKEQPDLINC